MNDDKLRLAVCRAHKQAARAYVKYTRRPTLATRWKYVQKFAEFARAECAFLGWHGFELDAPWSGKDPFYVRTDWLGVL